MARTNYKRGGSGVLGNGGEIFEDHQARRGGGNDGTDFAKDLQRESGKVDGYIHIQGDTLGPTNKATEVERDYFNPGHGGNPLARLYFNDTNVEERALDGWKEN